MEGLSGLSGCPHVVDTLLYSWVQLVGEEGLVRRHRESAACEPFLDAAGEISCIIEFNKEETLLYFVLLSVRQDLKRFKQG